jgi:cyclopropane fatty-acyl-phospholipid synthase-like methyltransferase
LYNDYWQEDVDRIYQEYSVYHQGDGSEQMVFIDGISEPRSKRIISGLIENYSLLDNGHLLDIGCGNGSFLRTFHECKPEWHLSGSEINDHDHEFIYSIPRFETLWCCSPKEIPGIYNVISMIHVLEHIVSPVCFLKDIRGRLSDDGVILIEVPNYKTNPFDLIIADHATHFSPGTLQSIVEMAGLNIIWMSDSWVPKEITLVARKSSSDALIKWGNLNPEYAEIKNQLEWLSQIREKAINLTYYNPIGIFGTSIAATWIFGELHGNVAFFVDEDSSRIGKTHLGRPVFSPADVPNHSNILIPSPPLISEKIGKRLQNSRCTYYW